MWHRSNYYKFFNTVNDASCSLAKENIKPKVCWFLKLEEIWSIPNGGGHSTMKSLCAIQGSKSRKKNRLTTLKGSALSQCHTECMPWKPLTLISIRHPFKEHSLSQLSLDYILVLLEVGSDLDIYFWICCSLFFF